MIGWLIALLAAGALLYWLLILTEGAYLGRRVVTWLYDRAAPLYDRIKGYEPEYEFHFLGRPLSRALATISDPLLLDVATGTGRLPHVLLEQTGFRGTVVGVDLSRRMLAQAAAVTAPWAGRIVLLWQDATVLPFPDDTFDAVACLEALEFMPHPDRTLREMVRVLRAGGTLLTTNRVGEDARWMPGRTCPSDEFERKLRALSLEMIRVQPWQEDYDLVWATKPGVLRPPRRPRRWDELLRCPRCGSPVTRQARSLTCAQGHTFPIAEDGIVELTR